MHSHLFGRSLFPIYRCCAYTVHTHLHILHSHIFRRRNLEMYNLGQIIAVFQTIGAEEFCRLGGNV